MDASPLISVGLPMALFIIMIGIGLTLTPAEFHHEARHPQGWVIGTVLQIVAMPLLAWSIIQALGLPPALAVGLMIIAACPGGTTSNLVAYLARSNVALSILLTVSCSLITILTLPLVVNWALLAFTQQAAQVQLPVLKTIVMLGVLILVPVVIGMVFRHLKPTWALKADKAVSVFGAVVLIGLIVAICVSNADRLGSLLATAGPACLLLNVGGVFLGVGLSRAAGLTWEDAFTNGIELGIKNGTLGLLIAMNLLHDTDMAVPSAIYGVLMYAVGLVTLLVARRLIPKAR